MPNKPYTSQEMMYRLELVRRRSAEHGICDAGAGHGMGSGGGSAHRRLRSWRDIRRGRRNRHCRNASGICRATGERQLK